MRSGVWTGERQRPVTQQLIAPASRSELVEIPGHAPSLALRSEALTAK